MGSDAGGERAAAIYSLVETAKLNGLDPEAYLREVLEPHRRSSDQPHRRVAAVEHRPTAAMPNDEQPEHGHQGSTDQGTRRRPAAAHRAARHQAEGLASRPGARDDHPGPAARRDPGRLQWGGGHLHEFEAAGERYGTSDPDYDPPGSVRSERIKLTSALTGAGTIELPLRLRRLLGAPHQAREGLAPMDMKLPVCVGGATRRRPTIAAACRAMRSSCRPWPIQTIPNTRTWRMDRRRLGPRCLRHHRGQLLARRDQALSEIELARKRASAARLRQFDTQRLEERSSVSAPQRHSQRIPLDRTASSHASACRKASSSPALDLCMSMLRR